MGYNWPRPRLRAEFLWFIQYSWLSQGTNLNREAAVVQRRVALL
jgi:hypothetical protein